MFGFAALTFREFAVQETLPLATLHQAILEFLRGREEVVVFGAQAVNAYVPEPRMIQDIDLLSPRAAEFAEELREYLSRTFSVAVRVREIGEGRGYRLYQIQKRGNRHLVAVRPAETLPDARRIAEVLVIAPADLIASKVIAYHRRRGHPKSGTDWRDLAMLLLVFPELKQHPGPVSVLLGAHEDSAGVLATWQELVAQEFKPLDDDGEFL